MRPSTILPNRSLSVLVLAMDRIDPERLANILQALPILARLGLAARDADLRARAAEKIALIIVDRLDGPEPPIADERQMSLSHV
jgi:hypothetical protein